MISITMQACISILSFQFVQEQGVMQAQEVMLLGSFHIITTIL
jgi:hypothetical protein